MKFWDSSAVVPLLVGWDPARHRAGKPRAAQQEHERLYAAIAAGDPRAARAAAVRHLMNSVLRMGCSERPARRVPRRRASRSTG